MEYGLSKFVIFETILRMKHVLFIDAFLPFQNATVFLVNWSKKCVRTSFWVQRLLAMFSLTFSIKNATFPGICKAIKKQALIAV